MKTSNLIIAALSAALLAACDKPTPTVEAPITATPISVVKTYNCNPQLNYVGAKPTYVYVYHSTANLSFDTVEFAPPYWRLFCFASEAPMFRSTYDTIHQIRIPSGNYKVLIDNIYRYSSLSDEGKEVDTVRWYHLHDVSVFDTVGFVIVDTFFRTEFCIE